MRSQLISILVFSFCISVAAQSQVKPSYEPPTEFRGIRWRTKFADLKQELDLVENGTVTQFYARRNDKLGIGDATVDKIVYGFHEEEFYTVIILFSGQLNYLRISDVVTQKYGEGYQGNRFIEQFTWGALSPVSILLSWDSVSGKGILTYQYKETANKAEAARKQKAASAKEDI